MARSKSARKEDSNTAMAKRLAEVLSDTYVLGVKTHGYHWNVMGPLFAPLHKLFGEQYEALFDAADEIAERIRALGLMPDGSMEAFLQNTAIKEADDKPLKAEAMVKDLLQSHQLVRARIIMAAEYADDIDDAGTEDLMVQRLQAHDKIIWMLRSQLA